MFSIPSAQLTGLVTEKRALIAKKDQGNPNAKPWAHIVKMLCMGGAYEVRCKNADVFDSAGEGETVVCDCTLELYNGNIQLNGHRFMSEAEELPARPAAKTNGKETAKTSA